MHETTSSIVSTAFRLLVSDLSPVTIANREVVLHRLESLLPMSVRPEGILKLALASDSLRAIAIASNGKCVVSHGDLSSLASWVSRCARLFANSGRPLYQDFLSCQGIELDHFLRQHRRDTELFGGNCAETEWSGFSIVRAAVELTHHPANFDRYEEFLLSWAGSRCDSGQSSAGLWIVKQLISDARSKVGRRHHKTDRPPVKQDPIADGPKEIAVAAAFTERDFHVIVEPLFGPALFEIRETTRSLEMVINENHPLADSLGMLVSNNGRSHQGLQKLFHAWAKLENSSGDVRRRLLEDVRYDWGRLARDVSAEDESL